MLKFSVLLISWAIHRSFDFTFLFIYYCIQWNIMFVIRPVNSKTSDENVYMFSDCNHLLLLLCYRCTRFPGNGQQNVGKHQRIVWDEFSAKITFAFNNNNNNGSGGLIRCCVQYGFLFSHFAHVYQTGKKDEANEHQNVSILENEKKMDRRILFWWYDLQKLSNNSWYIFLLSSFTFSLSSLFWILVNDIFTDTTRRIAALWHTSAANRMEN